MEIPKSKIQFIKSTMENTVKSATHLLYEGESNINGTFLISHEKNTNSGHFSLYSPVLKTSNMQLKHPVFVEQSRSCLQPIA